MVAQIVDHPGSQGSSRRAVCAISNQIQREKQPRATNITDAFVLFREAPKTINNVLPDIQGIFLQALVFNNIQYGECSGARDRIAAEGIEVAVTLGESADKIA